MSKSNPIHIGVDASNIRAGGGITHLSELLDNENPRGLGVKTVTVWSGKKTLDQLPDKPWLTKKYETALDKNLPIRTCWQISRLHKVACAEGCDILLIPGGQYLGRFRPFVAMSSNMLPFQVRERARFGASSSYVRFYLLFLAQRQTFQRADGIIFLSQFAQASILPQLSRHSHNTTVIPHGINARFFQKPRKQHPRSFYSNEQPIKLLYVSVVNAYKHHWNVVEAVSHLRQKGQPVTIDLVGGHGHPSSFKKLTHCIQECDPQNKFVRFHGNLPFEELHQIYHDADIFVFASSCENLPNILLEAMASGLPIACSDRGPMPEVLENGGVYFNPEAPLDIANSIELLINKPELRHQYASAAYEKAKHFNWAQCAQATFNFLVSIARQRHIRGGKL